MGCWEKLPHGKQDMQEREGKDRIWVGKHELNMEGFLLLSVQGQELDSILVGSNSNPGYYRIL